MTPKRIQRKRTKGWRMPPNTSYVGRGSKWGNPYKVVRFEDGYVVFRNEAYIRFYKTRFEAEISACLLYHLNLTQEDKANIRKELRGKNLCCWCPLNRICHSEILLEIANTEEDKEEEEEEE